MLDSSSFWRGLCGRAVRVATVALASIIYLATVAGWNGGVANAADQTLTVSTATANQLVLGQPIQVTVAAKSDTLMSGKIVISGESSAPTEYAIEVPAGTTKEVKVIGMPLQYPQEGYQITWYDADGKRVASTNLRSALRDGDTVVGVFPSVGTDFPETISQPTDTDSRLYTIPDDQLELPSVAFAQFDVIIATIDDVENLDDDLLSALRAWLGGGGRLVIDDGDAAAIAEVLEMPEPADRYGQGEILVTAGSLRPDGWEAATRPVGARSLASLGPIGWMSGGSIGMQTPTQGLVKYSGDPLIGTGLLLLLSVAYVLLVGPFMFIAFRRRRPALWVVGPLIAVGVCSLIWLDSARRRNAIHDAHGTVIAVSDAGSEVLSGEMLYVRSDKPVGVELPADYTLTANYDNYDPKSVDLGAEGTKVSQQAEVGSFVIYNSMGPAEQFDGQLTGTVAIDDDSASGEVTNHLAVDLHQVAVMWNGYAKNIGDVKAGETVKYTIDKSNRVAELPAMTVWGDAFTGVGWWGATEPKPSGQPRPDVVNLAVLDYVLSVHPQLGQTPNVDVIGWTDELDSPITGSSHGVSAVTATLDNDADADEGTSSFVYSTESANANNWAAESLVRLDAPVGVDDPVLTLGRLWQSAELLVDGEWVPVTTDATRSIAIERGMLDSGGGIYLKADLNLERVDPKFKLPRLHRAGADEKTVSLADAVENPEGKTATDPNSTDSNTQGSTTTTVAPPASLPNAEG